MGLFGIFKKKQKTAPVNTEAENNPHAKYEAEVLSMNCVYTSFSYIMDEETEIPAFFTSPYEDCDPGRGIHVYAVTPKMLKHCVNFLSDEAKLHEKKYLSSFIRKCKKLALSSMYQVEKWDKPIEELTEYIKNFTPSSEKERGE